MKTDLTDVTFLIPVKVDSVIRIENLLTAVDFLHKQFDTKIIVLEVAPYRNGILRKLLNRKIEYVFVQDKDPIFHRTKYRNMLSDRVRTPFLALWDADVLVDKNNINEAVLKLRSGEADIAYPFDGRFYDTSSIIRILFLKKRRISLLHKYRNKMSLIYGTKHKGGAFMANTEKFRQAGSENENFYGWGPEDYERYERWKNMNYHIFFSSGCMYHLTHPRDVNGNYSSRRQMQITTSELTRTQKSSREEILNSVK